MIYSYILYYLLGGILFNVIYDLVVDWLYSTGVTQDLRFSIKERLFVGLIWPFYLIVLIKNLFNQLFKNKDND